MIFTDAEGGGGYHIQSVHSIQILTYDEVYIQIYGPDVCDVHRRQRRMWISYTEGPYILIYTEL